VRDRRSKDHLSRERRSWNNCFESIHPFEASQFRSAQFALGHNLPGERDGLIELICVESTAVWNRQGWPASNHKPRLDHTLAVPNQIETSVVSGFLRVAATRDDNRNEVPRVASITG
jgi:hypothetical protein